MPRARPRCERVLRIDHYDWSGGREAMLRFGPQTGPVVVVAMPLFEEANRTRAFAVTLCRLLAKRGVASVLPDLPGQGESTLATLAVRLSVLQNGFAAVVERQFHEGRDAYSVAIRSGAIVDGGAHALGRWYLSPVSGRRLFDELAKILSAAKRERDVHLLRNIDQNDEEEMPTFEIAGNMVGTGLLQELSRDRRNFPLNGLGVPTRIVRLDADTGEANRRVLGTPLWRRTEPDNDPTLAALLADDIADWVARCEG